MRLKCFDGLRAISIIMVIVAHSKSTWGDDISSALSALIRNGGTGVRCFFVISGFLITYLLIKEIQQNGRLSLSGFYARRTLRIFPALFFYLGIVAVLTSAGWIDLSSQQFIAASTFTWNYGHTWISEVGAHSYFLGHLWSLSLEEQFYLVWPGIIILLGFSGSLRLAIVAIALMPVLRIATYFLFPDSQPFITSMFHTAVDPILIGAVGAVLAHLYDVNILMRRKGAYLLFMVCVIFLLIASPLLSHYVRGYHVVLGITLDSLAILFIIFWLQSYPDSFTGKLLESSPMVWIGTLSYSLYLWQQLFLSPLNDTLLGVWPINLLAVFVCAIFSYYIIEKPFLKIRDRLKKLPSAYRPAQNI